MALPKWSPQFSVKVRIPFGEVNAEFLIGYLVDELQLTYGDPRVRKSKSGRVMTATWEGLEITQGSGAGVESLVAEVMRPCDRATVKVYAYDPPQRKIPKRIIRQREDQYIDLLLGGNAPSGGMIDYVYRTDE